MKETKEFNKRIELAHQDLSHCKEYAELLLKTKKGKLGTEERVIFKALLTAFVISYGRVFTKSYTEDKELGKVISQKFKSLIVKCQKKLSPEQVRNHEILLEARNGIFAHSDANKHNLNEHIILGAKGYFGNDVFYGYSNFFIANTINNIDLYSKQFKAEQSLI